MENCRSDVEVRGLYVARTLVDTAMQPARQNWGYVESRHRKSKQWSFVRTVSGRRSVGWIYLWSVVGFIASRSDGWFVYSLIGQLEVWMVSCWLAD